MNTPRNNTPAPQRATDQQIASALADLEAPICDLSCQVGLVKFLFDEGVSYELEGDRATITLTRDGFEQLSFGVYDLAARIGRLKAAFYAAANGERAE